MKRKRKRRRSGNGTTARQWLYILANFPFIWIVKVGIAGDVTKREKQIDKSAKGWDFCIFKIKILFAYQVEQFVHRLCSPIQVSFDGSGKTERFFFLAAIPAFLLAVTVFVGEWLVYIGLLFAVSYAVAN